jgi:hypothetical protein
VVIEIFVAQSQSVDPLAEHFNLAVITTGLPSGIIQQLMKFFGEPQFPICLTEEKNASIAGDFSTVEIDLNFS